MVALKKYWWVVGLLLAVVVALFSPFASPHPDGLERVAEDQGFLAKAQDSPYRIMPDYVFPGIGNESTATRLAGVVGTLIVFVLGYGVAWLVRRRSSSATRTR